MTTFHVTGNQSNNTALNMTTNNASKTIDVTAASLNTVMNLSFRYGDDATINVASHANWTGGFIEGPGDNVRVNGPGNFYNTNSNVNGTAIINTNVSGGGFFNVFEIHSSGKLEFGGAVGAGQTVSVSGYQTYGGEFGVLQIDDPNYFAQTNLGFGEIILKGVKASGYSYHNDMLNLTPYPNGQVIGSIKLTLGVVDNYGPQNFGVSQVGGNVVIHADGLSYKAGGTLYQFTHNEIAGEDIQQAARETLRVNSKYFDTIPHADLLRSVARLVLHRNVLRLIKLWPQVPVEQRDGDGKRDMSGGKSNTRGTPQGGVASPLLSVIDMNRFLSGSLPRMRYRGRTPG